MMYQKCPFACDVCKGLQKLKSGVDNVEVLCNLGQLKSYWNMPLVFPTNCHICGIIRNSHKN